MYILRRYVTSILREVSQDKLFSQGSHFSQNKTGKGKNPKQCIIQPSLINLRKYIYVYIYKYLCVHTPLYMHMHI